MTKLKEPDYTELNELSEKLLVFANIEGTEQGEYWERLCDFSSYYFCQSPEFYTALINEIKFQLKEIDEKYKIRQVESKYMATGFYYQMVYIDNFSPDDWENIECFKKQIVEECST